MADELIDIVDENNNPLHITTLKSEAHKKGLWHRAAHIWIYNSQGEILFQLRSKKKLLYPNMWDISSAGHVSAGEEPIESALREIEEELGLSVRKRDLKFLKVTPVHMTYKKIINNEYCYVYVMQYNDTIKKLKIQYEELEKIEFIPISQLEKELKKKSRKYVPHGNYWSMMIAEIKKRVHKSTTS